MAQRIALGTIPGVGWRAADVVSVARQAEAAGFEAIFAAEVNSDVLATVQLMGTSTKTIRVGAGSPISSCVIPTCAPSMPP